MIRLEGVCKAFDSRDPLRYAVQDVTLHVRRGELLVLLGGSGSGKTTTLKMINRLIEPTRGTIHVDGQDVTRLKNPVELRRKIGYVVQGSGLFPHMTVAENIAVVPKLLRWKPALIHERINELLDLVKLPAEEYRDRFSDELSGGQQQRVGFARALAARPPVILLDEPFGALDPVIRDELRGDFLQLRKQLHLTAVMVTHDMTEALLSADRIAVMKEGRLLTVGTPGELLANPGDEYVSRLLNSPLQQTRQLETLLTGGVA
jgi:osmoprotectant transport system ATP-binding protein